MNLTNAKQALIDFQITRTCGDLDSVDVDRIKNIYKMLNESYQ